MKSLNRHKTITASDGDSKVEIILKVSSTDLMPEEANHQVEHLASLVMESVARTPFLKCSLSQVKIK